MSAADYTTKRERVPGHVVKVTYWDGQRWRATHGETNT